MRSLRLAIRVFDRVPEPTRAAEGERAARMVEKALADGQGDSRGSPVAIVVRAHRTELLDLRVPRAAGVPLRAFLAGLTRSNPGGRGLPVAVGVAGAFQMSGPEGAAVPVGVAFLEWPDCDWWQWQVLLDAEGDPLDDSVIQRCAEAGDTMPSGLGRWWSLGRRSGMRVNYGENTPVPWNSAASTLIH